MLNKKASYLYLPSKGEIIAYTAKAGQTTIHKMYSGAGGRMMSKEAALVSGLPITLYHRHPLDRLVSGYAFFQKGKFRDTHMHRENPKAHNTLFHVCGISSFEDWCHAAQELHNPHWCRQYQYHSISDKLVPHIVKDISQLGEMRLNPSKRDNWEAYFSDELLEEMTEYHKKDMELHAAVMAAGGTLQLP